MFVMRFGDGVTLAGAPPPPRNVTSMKASGSVIELTLKHGAVLQPTTIGGRVVLDMIDIPDSSASPRTRPDKSAAAARPAPVAALPSASNAANRADDTATQPAMPAPAPLPAPAPAPVKADATRDQPKPTPPAAAPQPVFEQNLPELAQQLQPGRDVMPENEGPVGLLARRVKVPKGMEGSAALVPFDSTTGAAAFQQGDATYVVFDERRPIDMSALKNDPVFAAASVQLLPNGTLLRIPLPPSRSLVLTQMPQGWRISALSAALKQQAHYNILY